MYSKKLILDEFYTTIDREQVKLETRNHGLEYLSSLKNLGTFDYGEFKNGIYKYKLSGINQNKFKELLEDHIDKKINLCTYFNGKKNNLFAFNLDSINKHGIEIKIITLLMLGNLIKLEIQPLIIKSGRGYHLWCRIEVPIENNKLHNFMDMLLDWAIYQAREKEVQTENLQCTCYPRVNSNDISIRLFGSEHIKTHMFSSIVTQINFEDTILNEEDSWSYFHGYMHECTITKKCIDKAYDNCNRKKISVYILNDIFDKINPVVKAAL